jgi:hypothetical protein
MPDVRTVSAKDVAKLHTEAEREAYLQKIPMRKLRGFERFTYYFENPRESEIYLVTALAFFVPLFGATVLVSYLQSRSRPRA